MRIPRIDWLLLAAIVAAAAVVYAIYALRIGNFQNDEEQYMTLARYIASHFPNALWQGSIYPRGVQRLDPTLLALPFGWLRGPGAYQVAHVMQSLFQASTAIPVFLLVRKADFGRLASLLAAILAVVVPWGVTATSYLAECLAYPAYAWVLYATWVTVRRPSLRNDALTLVALAAAALSRTAMLALAPLPLLAIAWHEWSWGLGGQGLLRRARELPHRLWSGHRLLMSLASAALLIVLADKLGMLPGRGLKALTGGYGVPHVEALSNLFDRYDDYLARMVVGTGFLAFAIGLPWTIRALVRPRDGRAHALAVICTLGVAMVLLSLLQAGPDERYVMYGAVPIAVAAAAGLSEWAARSARLGFMAALGVFAGAIVTVALIDGTTWPALANPYDFFSYPAAMFYGRSVLQNVALHVSALRADRFVEIAIVLAAILFASTVRRRRLARPAAALAAVGLIALSATQMMYSLRKFSSTAGAATGPNAAARSWVDRHVPPGAPVGALAVSMGETAAYLPIWRATEFWNTSVKLDVFLKSPGALPLPLGSELRQLRIDPTSGLLSGAAGGTNLFSSKLVPRYLLVPQQGTNRVGIEAKLVATDPYLPLYLLRLDSPARVDWSIQGTSPEGFLTSGEPAAATIYSGALTGQRHRCASFSLIAPPAFAGHWPYRVSVAGGTTRQGTLSANQTAQVDVPLPAHPTVQRQTGKLLVTVHGSETFAGGLVVSAKLAYFAVSDCASLSAR
jgi:hypothetical protein